MSTSLLFLIALLAGLGLAAPAMAQDQPETGQQEAAVAEKRADVLVYVDGMTCPFCAYGLEKKLSELDEVADVQVDLEKARALLILRDRSSLTGEQIQQAVDEAGFSVRKIERPARDTH